MEEGDGGGGETSRKLTYICTHTHATHPPTHAHARTHTHPSNDVGLQRTQTDPKSAGVSLPIVSIRSAKPVTHSHNLTSKTCHPFTQSDTTYTNAMLLSTLISLSDEYVWMAQEIKTKSTNTLNSIPSTQNTML